MDVEDSARGLGPTRTRVLAVLQDAGEPMAVPSVAAALDLHPNSARFHLDALTASGLVARSKEEAAKRGRPRMLYAAATASPRVSPRRYALLAEMLAGSVADHLSDPAGCAERTGREWSGSLAAPGHAVTEPEALEALVSSLDDVGFASRVVETEESLRVEVSHCPFLEVAERHHDVVCSVHLGLMRGLLERMDAPIGVTDLEPLVQPSLCLAHLSRSAAD